MTDSYSDGEFDDLYDTNDAKDDHESGHCRQQPRVSSLSLGITDASQPREAHHALITEGDHSMQEGVCIPGLQSQLGTAAVNGSPSSNVAPSNYQEMKNQAKAAILAIWPSVRCPDYIKHGIDRSVIVPLFEELGLDTGPRLDPGIAINNSLPEHVAGTPSESSTKSVPLTPAADEAEARKQRIAKLLLLRKSKSHAPSATSRPVVQSPAKQSPGGQSPGAPSRVKELSEKDKILQQKLNALEKIRAARARARVAQNAEGGDAARNLTAEATSVEPARVVLQPDTPGKSQLDLAATASGQPVTLVTSTGSHKRRASALSEDADGASISNKRPLNFSIRKPHATMTSDNPAVLAVKCSDTRPVALLSATKETTAASNGGASVNPKLPGRFPLQRLSNVNGSCDGISHPPISSEKHAESVVYSLTPLQSKSQSSFRTLAVAETDSSARETPAGSTLRSPLSQSLKASEDMNGEAERDTSTRNPDNQQKPLENPCHSQCAFTPYISPLAMFKAFRFHPSFSKQVRDGFRSWQCSHSINPKDPVCLTELLDGACKAPACKFQHWAAMAVTEPQIILELVDKPSDGTRQTEFTDGLKKLLASLKARKVKDFNAFAGEIVAYRRNFNVTRLEAGVDRLTKFVITELPIIALDNSVIVIFV